MVTITKIGEEYNSQILEISGLSTDPKPVDQIDGVFIANGSTFKEIDTGKEYTYNESAETWHINKSASSGGTGSGVNGKDGITPNIGENGNWFIGTVDTEVPAQGPAGENGVTPHIGTNGNWYIGSTDTGVSAKGVKGDNGLDGNGIKSAILNFDYTLTLTFDNGTTYTTPSIRGATGDAGSAGKNGTDGKDGSDGVGIASIKQTTTSTADGGNNVFTVTLTNGTIATFTVKNGSKGSTGKDGSNGVDGGHYTPVVTQPTTDTMQISFAPSKSDMPAVNPVTVNLPVSENSGQNQDYAALANKPRINGVVLSGDKTAADLGIEGATDEQVRKAVSDHLAANPVEASPMSGYTGLVWDAGQWVAYNPLVQTIADRARATKLSAYLQHYANEAKPVSPAGVLSHESSIAAPGIATWVENVAGTANDVPTIDGVTAVKARYMGAVYNFPKVGDIWEPEGDAVVVAQQGDEVINTVTGEAFAIPGGTGYQTFVNGSHVLCGYVPSYNQLRGMTVPVSYGSDGASPIWGVRVGTRNSWTLTIDGELGEYVYSRLPAPANTAVLHPSNQVAKIGSTYYRADVVPSDGIVICSSTDLINWTYVAHVHLPEGFASKGLYEACLGTKQNRLYAAIRQKGTTGALYLCKLAADLKSVNTIVALPDCSSKPYFVPLDNNNLLLATAPVDRYSCLVYNILDSFNITKILPVFEVSGVACNYPHLATIGNNPALLAIIGTNGAQTDLNGVSALPCMIYWKNIIKRVLAPTDIMLHDAEKAVTWGNIYELPVFPAEDEGAGTE